MDRPSQSTAHRSSSSSPPPGEDEPHRKHSHHHHNQHQEIIANHYNSRGDGGHQERNQSNIYHMRNFNNWIKSVLINTYVERVRGTLRHGDQLRALDMCCGKGGDLIKWREARVNHLVCTDIAAVSVDQCKQRYENMGGRRKFDYKIEYHACDATVERQRSQYEDSSIRFHVVSCQFAFHYCFESLPQAECMLRNASECLAAGGYFFGTIPNADEIMRRRQLSDEDEFGNEVYKISFECNANAPPLFGAKYNFYLDGVVNCPEFLVHFPTLVKLARKYGLRLVERKPFPEFFREKIQDGRHRGLLERMKALETFQLKGKWEKDASNYVGVREYMEGRKGDVEQVGTLSKCEWETVCLYQVFAFEKVKGEYNKAGEMEYKF